MRKLNSKLTGTYNENITGVRVVKALVREEQNLREFSEQSSELYRASFRAAWLSALFLPIVQVIGAVGLGTIVWYGGLQARIGGMTIGGIQAFLSYVTFMLWPIQDLARVYAELQRSVASAERVFSLMDAEPDVTDREGAVDPGTIRGDIEFERVGFYYEKDKDVLVDLDLHVRQGERIALVGPTGGGKSTIVNLLCRFYEPTSGTIRFDGRDYRELTQNGDPIADRHGPADAAPFFGHDPGEYPLWAAGRHRRGGAKRRRGSRTRTSLSPRWTRATMKRWARAALCSRSGKSS